MTMDIEQGYGPEDEADAAERAFEALREEVAAQRRALEQLAGLVAQGRPPDEPAPDYSPTLGAMAQELRSVGARLDGIEAQPTLRLTPASYRAEIEAVAQGAVTVMSRSFVEALQEARGAARELEGLAGRVRERREQRWWLITAGVLGVMGGLFLWFMLVVLLPWGAGDWLAALPLGGRPWQAGQALMRHDSPESFDKMARLYKACGEQATELCETAIAVRTIPPTGQSVPTPESVRAGLVGASPQPHGRVGK